jgi:hypothetical protein
MKNNKDKLITLFKRKIEFLLVRNDGYARFKRDNIPGKIKELLSNDFSKEDIMDLGFLIHLYTLQLRLIMYENLTQFSMFNFKKDLQEIINALHVYQRQRNPQKKLSLEVPESPEIKELIPPLLEVPEQIISHSDSPELYSAILVMLGKDNGEIEMDMPEELIREMQHVDLKRIYGELPALIEKKNFTTVRELAADFPVFENDKLSLVAVLNEVLFLANEGKLCLSQMEGDIGIRLFR